MTKRVCDRCGVEVTGKKAAAVSGVERANALGLGAITWHADLCPRCYRALLTWTTTRPKA